MSCACRKGVSHTDNTLPRRHTASCVVDCERSLKCHLDPPRSRYPASLPQSACESRLQSYPYDYGPCAPAMAVKRRPRPAWPTRILVWAAHAGTRSSDERSHTSEYRPPHLLPFSPPVTPKTLENVPPPSPSQRPS
eukprot:6214514-Pleurochrysis_carterae.AAC.2